MRLNKFAHKASTLFRRPASGIVVFMDTGKRRDTLKTSQILTSLTEFRADTGRPTVLVVGTFDGVHLAHQDLIAKARTEAESIGNGHVAVLTFQNHPRSIVAPHFAPKLLMSWEAKAQSLTEAGAESVLCIPFDHDFSRITAEEFLRDIVGGIFQAKVVLSGPSFHFGRGGEGHVDLLEARAEALGFKYLKRPPLIINGEKVSSSRIRSLLVSGNVSEAGALLGRPPFIEGEVVSGDRLGRTIGFPTANLAVDTTVLLPADGVYAGKAQVAGGAALPAMINLGYRPTVSGRDHRIEAHLIDFEGDLVGKTIRLHLIDRLRNEMKFSGIDGLRDQLTRDREEALFRLVS